MISPDFAFLNLTFDCNNRCRWCYMSPTGYKKDMMKPGHVRGYLRLFRSLGMKDIGFIGGEPTMYPHLFDSIAAAKRLGLRVTLYTNGRRLANPEYAKALKDSGVYYVQIDIQSTDPEKHDWITRVKGSYGETAKGIENALEAGLRIRLLTVMCYRDFRVYRSIIDRYAGRNIAFVFFREIPQVTQYPDQKVLSNKESAKLIKRIFRYARESGVKVSFYLRMPLCWFDEKTIREMDGDRAFENLCHTMDGNSLNVDVNGSLLPCLHFVGYHMFSILRDGKVMKREELLEKWNSKRVYQMRTKLRGYPSRLCVSCRYYGQYCRGGCPLLKFEIGPYAEKYQKH